MPTYNYRCNDCGKTHVGTTAPSSLSCNCIPPKLMTGRMIATPLSAELLEVLDINAATTRRALFCTQWSIPNKSHGSHGANFSGNQKLVDLINDIVSPVQGQLRVTVRQRIIDDYGYDIDSRGMV